MYATNRQTDRCQTSFTISYLQSSRIKENPQKLVNKAVREAATICPRPLQVDLRPFDLGSDVRVTCDVATSVPILIFLGLSVLDLGPMYATNRQTDVRRASSLNAPYPRGGVIIRNSAYYRSRSVILVTFVSHARVN